MDWNHKISCSIHESLGPGAGGPLGQLGPGSLSPWPPRVLGYIQWTHKWTWIYLEIEFVVNHRITKSSCNISVLEWIMAPKKQGFGLPWRIQGSDMDRRPRTNTGWGKAADRHGGDKLNIMCEFQISHRHIGLYSNIPGEGLWLNMFILFLTQWFWCVNSIALWLHNNKPEPTCPIERSEFKVYPKFLL